MRAREFVKEASIFTRSGAYTYGHKVKVSSSKKGQGLINAIRAVIPDFDPKEELEWVRAPTGSAPLVQLSAATNIRSFKRPNGSYINIQGSDHTIEKSLVHAHGQRGSVGKNLGDLSEPVLSAAMVAKLIKRGGNDIGDITKEDLVSCLDAAINSNTNTYAVEDKNSKIADIIEFSISVREPIKEFIQSSEFWETYKPLLPSVLHYANSGYIDRYADHFYKNGKVDKIEVKSDGMSDQRGRKTDITATVNGQDLKHLQISLKAGSGQIGSTGAGSLKHDFLGPRGMYQSSLRLFGPLGINLTVPSQIPKTKLEWWDMAYWQAYTQLKDLLQGESAKAEAGIISKIANMIVDHATKGDENIRLVKLSKTGISTVHSFRGLMNKIISENIDLAVDYKGPPDAMPVITIRDANAKPNESDRNLVKISFHSTRNKNKVWNAITMEPLLSKLTLLSKQPRPAAPPQAGAVQPQSSAALPDKDISGDSEEDDITDTGDVTPGRYNRDVALEVSKIPMGKSK